MRTRKLARAVSAGLAVALLTLGLTEAAAGDGTLVVLERRHHDARPWYRQKPVRGTGPETYYSYYPDHVPGYPVPIFRTARPPSVYAERVVLYRDDPTDHVAWCAARYRSYRIGDNTYQPYHGPRRACRSPYG